MKTKLYIAGAGNLIDAIATYILTQYYGAIELNPFMAWLLRYPEFAMILKVSIVTLILIYVYYSERTKYSNTLATFAAVLYGFMGLYYIVMFIVLFWI